VYARNRLAALATAGLVAQGASANPVLEYYLDLMGDPQTQEVPEDGSDWLEIYNRYGTIHHQQEYLDSDFDGLISSGDEIIFSGGPDPFEVLGVFPSYHLNGGEMVFLSTSFDPPPNPVGETWMLIHPSFGSTHLVEAWLDVNDNDIFDAGDDLYIDGVRYSVHQIGLNASGYFTQGAAQRSSWSRIKQWLGGRR